MFMLNGKPLALDVAFTAGNINYPANWMRNASLAEKQAIGIIEVSDPAWYDRRFYNGVGIPKALEGTNEYASYDSEGNGIGSVTNVIPGLKTNFIKQQKNQAGSLLSNTDWMVVRYSETGKALPSSTATYRSSVRTQCQTREAQISACDTTDELAALINNGKMAGTATNGATEKFDTSKEVKDGSGNSYDPKRYESFDPKQYNEVVFASWPNP